MIINGATKVQKVVADVTGNRFKSLTGAVNNNEEQQLLFSARLKSESNVNYLQCYGGKELSITVSYNRSLSTLTT